MNALMNNYAGEVLRTLSRMAKHKALTVDRAQKSVSNHYQTYFDHGSSTPQQQRRSQSRTAMSNAHGAGEYHHAHVPYLNSKLTHLLRDSFGGNCKSVFIANIHTSAQYLQLTTTTLQYATWAKSIRSRAFVNHLDLDNKWVRETDEESCRLR